MNNLRENILKLRNENKTYNEICQILKCSKGIVSYHCGKNQKQKHSLRQKNRRKDIVILRRVERFQNKTIKKDFRSKCD